MTALEFYTTCARKAAAVYSDTSYGKRASYIIFCESITWQRQYSIENQIKQRSPPRMKMMISFRSWKCANIASTAQHTHTHRHAAFDRRFVCSNENSGILAAGCVCVCVSTKRDFRIITFSRETAEKSAKIKSWNALRASNRRFMM